MIQLEDLQIEIFDELPFSRHKSGTLDPRYSRFNFAFSWRISNFYDLVGNQFNTWKEEWQSNQLVIEETARLIGPYNKKGSWHPKLKTLSSVMFFVEARDAALFKLRFG